MFLGGYRKEFAMLNKLVNKFYSFVSRYLEYADCIPCKELRSPLKCVGSDINLEFCVV